MKRILTYVTIALAIGSVVSGVCIALMSGMDSTITQVFAWLAASVLYGLVSMIYETERFPLPALIGIHLLLCFGITIVTASLLGYADSVGALAIGILPSFLIIYAVVTVVALGTSAHAAKKINEKLK